ncbi:hypothetical protein GCK32_006852 [Trichostrongylus colubriformis]|uniref:Uncharacterized protein n=1 Tax=Trichostrongylus colubriformis TaxID=6319 RepID=A0AAN8IG05_TRICO
MVFPLFCLLVVVVCVGIFALSKKNELAETMENRDAALALNKAEESEYQRCEATQSSEHNDVVKSDSEMSANKTSSGNLAPTDVSGAVRLVDLNSDRKQTNGLLSKESLQELCDQHSTANCKYLKKRTVLCRSSELSKWWSVTSFGFATLFLIAAPAVHYRYTSFPSEDYEARSIVDYLSCGTAHAITNRSIDWTANGTWPSSSIVNAPWCSLPLNQALARMDGVLIVFILLPAMPFLVLFVAFIAGLSGYGGMTVVRTKRDDVGDPPVREGKAERFQLLPTEIKEQTTAEKAFPLESGSAPQERDENEDGASSNSQVGDGLSSNILGETEADNEVKSQTEEHQKVWTIINQLRGELVFQQSMLVNDSAAWSICLHIMRKIEHTLSQLNPQMSPTSAAAQGLRTLTEEMSHILPTVSDHAIQLSRWMQSVQHACLKLERISASSTSSDLHSCIESQDINRQQNLLALNNYLLARQAADLSQQSTSATCPEKEPRQQIKPSPGPSTRGQNQSNQVERPQQSINVEPAASITVPGPECVAQPGTSQQHQPIVQNAPVARSSGHADARPLPNGVAHEPERLSGSAGSQPQRVPRISAYAVSYSATPRGFLSRLTVPELRIRIEQIRNICAGDVLFPQELSYMLLASGDIIYAGNQPQDGFHLYTIEQMPELFGTRVPTIDVRIGVQAFLSHMRRRALTVVGAVGYHFSLRPRRGTDYTPPVLPPLGLYRSENELTLRRVLGDSDDILPLIRDFLREYNFGRGPINPRPDLKFALAFRRYLCLVAAREGFNNEVYEDYVPDPEQPAEPMNGVQENSHDSSAEEPDPPAPSY